MALFFDLTQPDGAVSRIELKPGIQRLRVMAGDRYRIIDEQGNTPPGLLVRRYDNHLLVDDGPSGVRVELTDYYGRCSVSAACTLEIVSADGSTAQITPATEPVRALTDGSFVMYQGSGASGGIAPLAAPGSGGGDGTASDSGINGWMIGGGLLGLVAVAAAAGGGGGGGSDSPTAVNPSPPAPVPTPGPDTTAPSQPVITSGTVSNHGLPVLAGTAEPGATVRASYDLDRNGSADVVYQTTAGADGTFVIDLATATPISGRLPAGGLPDGPVAVSVVAVDGSNNASPPSQFMLDIDATAPNAPRITSVTDNVGAQTGPIANGAGTDDLTPTVSGRLDQPLAAGERVVILRNGVEVASLNAVPGTTWTYEDSGLALGQTYVYEARVVNAVGNTSATSNGWQIQTRADPAPTLPTAQITSVVDDAPRNTGPIANGGVTNDRTPTVTGQLSAPLAAGQSLEVLRNGQPVAVQVAVNGNTFSFTDTTLTADGTYTYQVRPVQGTTAGAASAGYAIVLDTTNTTTVTLAVINDNQLPTVGNIANGGSTNDTTPTLRGVVSAPLAQGDRIEVVRNGVIVEEITTVNAQGTWVWSDSGLQVGQTYSYQVRVVDAAGNVGRSSAAFRIQIVATTREDGSTEAVDPDAPVVPVDVGPTDPTDSTVPGATPGTGTPLTEAGAGATEVGIAIAAAMVAPPGSTWSLVSTAAAVPTAAASIAAASTAAAAGPAATVSPATDRVIQLAELIGNATEGAGATLPAAEPVAPLAAGLLLEQLIEAPREFAALG